MSYPALISMIPTVWWPIPKEKAAESWRNMDDTGMYDVLNKMFLYCFSIGHSRWKGYFVPQAPSAGHHTPLPIYEPLEALKRKRQKLQAHTESKTPPILLQYLSTTITLLVPPSSFYGKLDNDVHSLPQWLTWLPCTPTLSH